MNSLATRKCQLLRFSGPMVAAVTPFLNNKPNIDTIEVYVRYLINIGARGAYVHGTTGEGVSLTLDEKKAVTKAWASAVSKLTPKLALVINVSSTVMSESKELAALCDDLEGVSAIATLPSFYYRAANAEQVVDHLADISAAAPNSPLVYYHFPHMTKVQCES